MNSIERVSGIGDIVVKLRIFKRYGKFYGQPVAKRRSREPKVEAYLKLNFMFQKFTKNKKFLMAAMMLCFCVFAKNVMGQNTLGYIANVKEDGKIILKLQSSDVKASDVLYVMSKEEMIKDKVSGDVIRLEPERIGQIRIVAVNAAYTVAEAMGNLSLEMGMTVQRENDIPPKEVTVMIAPAVTDFPEGANNMVLSSNGEMAYLGDYVSAALMEHLLKSNKIQLLDRSILAAREIEKGLTQNSEIDFNTALDYGRLKGARYIIRVTMQKPDVVNVDIIDGPVPKPKPEWFKKVKEELGKFVPENVKTNRVKVSVNIKAHVIDLQTGVVLFMSSETGKASGSPQIDLEISALGRNIRINQGANFNQTVTGKAIENAFKKIGRELNIFFEGKI